ncbi:cytidine deaminase-like protein [Polychytrium aggregatum]|uniref:cytidine deaminase-like protein n=1 Tax=Polychytrium aggregatum TaxID=110093 RepID=UPI0022FE21E2|nr:cytidine deaminase-like protein [Polychytrium aggregatum]KAI9202646.1 cytidine deaminase-like protein [Polychytrium aggregatum]
MSQSFLAANASNRIRSKDMFMLIALWMEKHPNQHAVSLSDSALPTGAVLVDAQDHIVTLETTGASHAIVRAILSASIDPQGCDIYVSRFPCSLCTKLMVQAGIRKCYYFPSKRWELGRNGNEDPHLWSGDFAPNVADRPGQELSRYVSSPLLIPPVNDIVVPALDLQDATESLRSSPQSLEVIQKPELLEEKNRKSVQRLVSNNPIALSLFIPQWDHSPTEPDAPSGLLEMPEDDDDWAVLDARVGEQPGITQRWTMIQAKFKRTVYALRLLSKRYMATVKHWQGAQLVETTSAEPVMQHAMVLAHIAAKRTDDNKVGVGAVLVDSRGTYISVGWNGYPKRSQHLDYPQAGADDSVEDDELKYDYILHAEQNALLWRSCRGKDLSTVTCVSTKMPCDECSPIISDCGVRRIVTTPQFAKSKDDPARFRGLTYGLLHQLVDDIYVFDVL